MMQRFYFSPILKVVFIFLFSLITRDVAKGQTVFMELPEKKQTSVELYVSVKEAYEKWIAYSDKIQSLDFRTPDVFVYIRHAGEDLFKAGRIAMGIAHGSQENLVDGKTSGIVIDCS